MQGDLLTTAPGVQHHSGLRNVDHLFDGVELAKHVMAQLGVRRDNQVTVAVAHVLHMTNPVVGQAYARAFQRCEHTAATIVTDHHEVFDVQLIHCVLDGGQAVQISGHDHVGHVAVHKYLTRLQARDLVGWHTAVRAPDPHVLGLLLGQQTCEKAGALALHLGCPGTVVNKQVVDR